MTKKLSELSAFFPCYNEQENINALVESAMEVFPTVAEQFEVIIVNDGSTDRTAELADQLSEKYTEVRVLHGENRGYGGALQNGFDAAQYEWVFFSDADLQFDLSEIKFLVDKASEGDFIIGYRESRADPLLRIVNQKLLLIWTSIFLGIPKGIRDINCAFKLFKRSYIEKAKPFVSEGAMINTELLIKSHKNGAKFIQVPVSHFPRKHGTQTGANLGVIFRAITETWKLR